DESLGLKRVLIDRWKFDRLRARVAEPASVVNPDAAGTIGRRIERNLHLDAAGGAENVHSLIGHQLAGARKDRLARIEAQQCRRQTVHAEVWVALELSDDLHRLGAEEPACDGDGIAADVEQGTAAPFAAAAHVVR